MALLRAGTLAESDTFWQVRTGLTILATHAIPDVDAYSWTAAGEPWTLNSWGFDVALAGAFQIDGLAGVALLGSGLIMLLAGAVLLVSRDLGANPVAAATVLLLTSPLLIAWLSARPQLADYIALPLMLLLLRRLSVERLWSTVGYSAALFVLWVNLHAAVLLGLVIVLFVAVALMLRPQTRRQGRSCFVVAAIGAAASLVNPYGALVFTQAARVRGASADVVTEWQHINLSDGSQLAVMACGILALVLAARRRDIVLSIALAVTLMGAVAALRVQPMVVLLSVPLLAAALTHPVVSAYAFSRRMVLIPGAILGLLSLVVLAAPSLSHLGRPDPDRYPTGLIEKISAECTLFNSYELGGLVLLRRPDVKVSVDSRNDLYGPDRVREMQDVVDGTADKRRYLDRAGCVLVPPSSELAVRLASDPHWDLVSLEPNAVLYERAGSP